jgi:hypothetical protein
MKTPLRPLVTILAAVLIFSGAHADAKGAQIGETHSGLRRSLVSDKGVEAFYAIDDYMTYIVADAGWNKPNAGHTVVYTRVDGGKKYYMIRHASPEPMVYKSRVLPDISDIAGFYGIEPGEYAFVEGRSGYGAIDLYQHTIAACAKLDGELTFVIPRSSGKLKRLTKVDAFSAFRHILASGGLIDTVWYIACDGEERFMVEKNYRVLSGDVEMATVSVDRGLEGVDYAESWASPEELKGIEGILAKVASKVTGKPHKPSKKFLKQMVREVAFMKGNLVRIQGASRYTGSYSASSAEPECGDVSIKHIHYEPKTDQTRVNAYDYRLCGGNIKRVGTSEKSSPGKLDLFAMLVKGLLF